MNYPSSTCPARASKQLAWAALLGLFLALFTPAGQADPLWRPASGQFGGAVEFDGIDDFAVFQSPLFDVGNQGTVSFWVKMNATGKRNQFFEGAENSGFEIQYRENSSGQVYGRATTVGGDFVIRSGPDGATLNDNWANIQVVWDFDGLPGDASAKMRIYVNGAESSYLSGLTPTDLTWAAVVSTVNKQMSVGRDPGDNTRFFSGLMDDIVWFNAPLDTNDRANVRTNGASVLLADARMVAYWNLDQSSGNTAVDGKNGIELKFSTDGISPLGPQFLPSGGHFGGALEFDGHDDLATFDFGANDLGSKGTLSFWTYMYETNRRNEFLVGPGPNGLEVQFRETGGGQVYGRASTPAANDSDFVIRNGPDAGTLISNWVNIQIIYDFNGIVGDTSAKMRVFLNGAETAYVSGNTPTELTWPAAVSTVNGLMSMGRDPDDPTRFLKGRMDDVAWYNDVLSVSERQAIRDNPVVADPRLVAYWNLDDAPGTTIAPGNAGTSIPLYIQASAQGPGPIFRPGAGVFGGALDFDGINDFGSFNFRDFNLGEKGTASFWVKLDDASQRHQFFEGPGNSNFEIQYRPNVKGQFYARSGDAAGNIISSGSDGSQVNQWVNIQLIWNFNGLAPADGGNKMRLYTNGVEVNYLTSGNSNPTNLTWNSVVSTVDGIMYVGRDPGDPLRYHDGMMDDIAFFNDVLSAAERAALLTGPASAMEGDARMVAYWALDNDPGTVNIPGDAGTTIPLFLGRVAPARDIAVYQGADVNGTEIFDGQVGVTVPATTIGTSTTNDFTIANVGGTDLTLTNITAPTGFTVLNAPAPGTVLQPNESVTFQLRLEGFPAGIKSGQVEITSNDPDERPFNFAISGEVIDNPPYDITLTNNVIFEQQPIGTVVGELLTNDEDIPGDTHVYTLVSGTGCNDNEYFAIDGNLLVTASNFVYATRSTFLVRIRTTDLGGLYYEEEFFILIKPLPSAAPAVRFGNDFTVNNSGWDATPGPALTLDGEGHGVVPAGSPETPTSAVTDFNGYNFSHATGSGFVTSLDINLDTNTPVDSKFTYLMSINDLTPAEVVDFAFLVQRVDLPEGSGFRINTAQGDAGSFVNLDGTTFAPEDDNFDIVVTNSGYYTFQHWFHTVTNAGTPYLTVDMTLLDANTNVLASWTFETDLVVGVDVSGNGYGKIVGNEFASLLVDNSRLTLVPRPTALPTGIVVDEDHSSPILLAGAEFPPGVTLSYKVTTGPLHGTLSVTTGNYFSNPVITYTPSADYFGADNFKFVVNNGSQDSLVATVTIAVESVNDAPSFALSVSSTTVAEDAPSTTLQIVNSASVSKGAANESGQLISYEVFGYNAGLFMTQPTVSSIGYLTFRPAANVSGSTVIQVRAVDNGGTACAGVDTSVALPFTISITPSNDIPVLAPISNVTTNEGLATTPDVLVPLTLTDIETDLDDMVLLVTVSNATSGLITSATAEFSGGAWRLRLQVAAERSGTATIHVRATDTGESPSPARFVSRNFIFTVNAVNDAPTFIMTSASVHSSPGVSVSTAAFSAFRPNANLHPDPVESVQTATYAVTVPLADKAKFTVQPTINASGTLSYRFAVGATGSIVTTVKVTDSGGTSGGGVNVSSNQTLTFNVDP